MRPIFILLLALGVAGCHRAPEPTTADASTPPAAPPPTTSSPAAAGAGNTGNIIVVMTDGLRWQEVFNGADAALVNATNGGVKNVAALEKAYWRDTPGDRRAALMPFLWNIMATQGQVYGNRDKGSGMHVTNGLKFSYPGYSETLCGFVDPRIDSNDYGPNPNQTVLEWLNQKPAFHGQVAAFAAWGAFDRILNRDRCDFYVNTAYNLVTNDPVTPRAELINQLKEEMPRYTGDEPCDALEFYAALEYFKVHHPRVFFVMLDETDDWAHAERYDEYLNAAHRADEYVKTLWETAQSYRQYRDKTTIIFLPDHGRGSGPVDWRNHGKNIAGAENTWLAVLGPDTPAFGERANIADVTQNQIASTLAALLGENYQADVPQAGKPIADVLGKKP